MVVAFLKNRKEQLQYLALQGVAAVASVILGKVIALYYNPQEFGRYFIFSNLVTLYASVVTFPGIQSFRHFYHRQDPDAIVTFYRSLLLWLFTILAIILCFIGAIQVVPMLIVLLSLVQIFSQTNSALNMANINIRGHTLLQSILMILLPCTSIFLLGVMVFILSKRGYSALWFSMAMAEVVLLAASFLAFNPNKTLRLLSIESLWKDVRLRQYFQYVKPILPLPIFIWTVNSVDRYILDLYYTKQEVGLYSAAYGISSKIFLLLGGMATTYLNATVYKEVANGQTVALKKRTNYRVLLFFGFGIGIVLLVCFLYPFIGKLLLSGQYAGSFQLIPLLAFANLIFSCIYFYEQVVYAVGRTQYILFHYGIGALLNIGFNFVLIPRYGVWGAGISMILSSVGQVCTLMYFFRKLGKSDSQPL